MDGVIRLREHRVAEEQLSDSELAVIATELRGRVEAFPTGQMGVYRLRADSHVGVVVLPTGRTLVIEPKIPVETLFGLLAAVYDPSHEVFQEASHPYLSIEGLFEFVVRMFVSQVEELVARGIMRGYRGVAEDLEPIRGRLLLAETIRQSSRLGVRHCCSYRKFTPDVAENRILAWTTFCLRPLAYREANLASRMYRLGLAMSDVRLDSNARFSLDSLEFHRLNSQYRPALLLAKLLLDHLTFSGTTGTEPFLAYLVNMNWLFEKFMVHAISIGMKGPRFEVVSHAPANLDLARHVIVFPDAVVRENGAPIAVVDAKYKLEAAEQDVYQMIAYCHALGLSTAFLVHPESEQPPSGTLHILGTDAIKVQYLSLRLSGGIPELGEQAAALPRYILEELGKEEHLQDVDAYADVYSKIGSSASISS